MPVLRSIESKLEALFEGVFGRAFRTNVQPVELARKLVKEMDDHRNISVSRVYVPNEYTVYLAPQDREQFASYERQLQDELAEYLAGHARREGYALLTPPRVLLETDPDLDIGVFGIATRMVEASKDSAEDAAPNATMVYRSEPAPPVEPVEPVEPEPQEVALLRFGGATHELTRSRVVLGRSRDADIQVADPNVSRRHAEVRQEDGGYWLVDLDSTNGIEFRNRRVKRLKLDDGTTFTLGSTEIEFDLELR